MHHIDLSLDISNIKKPFSRYLFVYLRSCLFYGKVDKFLWFYGPILLMLMINSFMFCYISFTIFRFEIFWRTILKVIHNLQELQDTDWCSPNKNWVWERVAGQRLSLSQVFHHHQHYKLSSHVHHQIISWYGCHLVFWDHQLVHWEWSAGSEVGLCVWCYQYDAGIHCFIDF